MGFFWFEIQAVSHWFGRAGFSRVPGGLLCYLQKDISEEGPGPPLMAKVGGMRRHMGVIGWGELELFEPLQEFSRFWTDHEAGLCCNVLREHGEG